MHTQMYFVYGLVFVSAMFFFSIFFFAKITDLLKNQQKNSAYRKLQREREQRRKNRSNAVAQQPVVATQTTPKPEARAYTGPIRYKHRLYASASLAAKKLGIELSTIVEDLGLTRGGDDDHSIWKNAPTYSIARRHRCVSVGRSKKRLFISDYPGGTSTGYVKSGDSRIPLDRTVETGLAGDRQLLDLAIAA